MNPTHRAFLDIMREAGDVVFSVDASLLTGSPRDGVPPVDKDALSRAMEDSARVYLQCHFDHYFAEHIAAHAEDGKVAVVWAGRDCDGVQYSGEVRLVEAVLVTVVAEIEHYYKWADGPCSYAIVKPSEAAKIEYASRDLTMEAFENGRTYNITPEN